jgi:hypothetical protein
MIHDLQPYPAYKGRDSAFISPEHYATLGDHSVIADDLLIAGLGDEQHPTGRACVAPPEVEPAMVKSGGRAGRRPAANWSERSGDSRISKMSCFAGAARVEPGAPGRATRCVRSIV